MAGFLSELDGFFLHADTGTQHLHVLATLLLDTNAVEGGITYEAFQRRMRERAPLVEALRRRPVRTPLGPTIWVDDPLDDLERHLHHVVVDGGGPEVLAEWTGRIASAPMAKDRPLWEVWLVEGLDDGRAGVVAKVHHAAVDGVSGIWSLAAFFDLDAEGLASLAQPYEPPPAVTPADVAREALTRLRSRPVDVARKAARVAGSAAEMLRSSSGDTPMVATAPRLPFNGPLTARREVAFARVPLDDLKEVRRAFGVTINDVIVGLVAGVVRRRLQDDGVEVPDRPLVAAVPTSEREAEHGMSGNRLSFMLYGLPAELDDPGDRLAAVQRSSAAAKALYERTGQGLLADAAGLLPPLAVGPLLDAASRLGLAARIPPLANVIVSNVRGPDFPLYVAGSRLESMFPMGPLMEGVGLGVTVVTYRDEVGFGFVSCPDLLPDVAGLAATVADELVALRAAAV